MTACDMDTVRDFVTGALSGPERAAFERRLETDTELAALVEDYRIVHECTTDLSPVSRTEFEDLAIDAAPARRHVVRRIIAVAAALVIALPILYVLSQSNGERPEPRPPAVPLALAAIPLVPVDVPESPAIPAIAADYDPRGETGLRFLEDVSAARALARAADRPVLYFAYFPGCPICESLEKQTFPTDLVRAAANNFVLVKIRYDDAVKTILKDVPHQYPVFVAHDADGETAGLIHGQSVFKLGYRLRDISLDVAPRTETSRRSWMEVRRLAGRLRDAEASSDPADYLSRLVEIAREDADGEFGGRARALLAQMKSDARSVLFDAQSIAANSGAEAAAAHIRSHGSRFTNTPYGEDLRRVAKRIERDGRFPPLEND
ncbi:MAG: thioredoxin family protein [Planctomycetota bacterium]